MSEFVDRIDRVIQTLEAELDLYDQLRENEANAIADYKNGYAAKWHEAKDLSSLKTAGDRDAHVQGSLKEEFRKMKIAEAKAEAQKQRTQTLRAILNGLQTLASTTKKAQDSFG